MASQKDPPAPPDLSFIGKVLMTVLVLVVLLTFWRLAQVFLLGFGGIVIGVALNNMAAPLTKKTGMSYRLALAITTVGLIVVTVGFLFVFGAGASAQFVALIDRLPDAWESARDWLQSFPWGSRLIEATENSWTQAAATLLSALPLAGGFLGGLANAALIIVLGIYFAADPHTYVNGALRLLPPERRTRAREILHATGDNLRKWLAGMTLDMMFLGVITGVGLWLVGVPFAFPLGVLSGLSVFVPYIGPIVASLPGVLLALSVSPTLALYALIVYVIAQQLEGNISLPLLQRWTVSMPPVLSLLSMVAFGILFGFWGVLLATPMAVACQTIIQKAYVEDVLERKAFG
jgi:predicted PurR-regulated permease PerM